MALIINLETSTHNCSVALSEGGKLLAVREESSDQYIHSEKLHLFIREVLSKANCKARDLEAVAVGSGPGSYTGLRIGVSAAKGLAYSLNIPLLAMDGIRNLVRGFLSEFTPGQDSLIVPMIDARRMEVYCAIYNHLGTQLSMIEARVIAEGSFDHLQTSEIHLIGDGAEKCRNVLADEKFHYHSFYYPSARYMAAYSEERFREGKFADTAYFEPTYLKNFVAEKSKKLL